MDRTDAFGTACVQPKVGAKQTSPTINRAAFTWLWRVEIGMSKPFSLRIPLSGERLCHDFVRPCQSSPCGTSRFVHEAKAIGPAELMGVGVAAWDVGVNRRTNSLATMGLPNR